MDNEDELEALRRKKLMEMQGNLAEQKQAEDQQKAQEVERAKRAQILRQILAPDARERLSNVRLVRPDIAENVENQLIQLASMGRINRLLTDSDIKDILARVTETKRDTKIERR